MLDAKLTPSYRVGYFGFLSSRVSTAKLIANVLLGTPRGEHRLGWHLLRELRVYRPLKPLLIKSRLLDQRVALEWINAHIRSFGGNPHDITLFGNSSGAGDFSSHCPLTVWQCLVMPTFKVSQLRFSSERSCSLELALEQQNRLKSTISIIARLLIGSSAHCPWSPLPKWLRLWEPHLLRTWSQQW